MQEQDIINFMNHYFSIGEVSKIKGVGIKSLRYYDKIGVLKPAYVNPNTGYRNYTIKQLFELDIISLCVELGIPLKSLENYYDNDKELTLEKLLCDSKILAEEKIKNIQIGLEKIERLTDNISCYRDYADQDKIYERKIAKRNILGLPFDGNYNCNEFILKLSELFLLAKEMKVNPTYQAGLLYEFNGDNVKKYIFTEVLENLNNDMMKTIPCGLYLCHRDNHSCIDESKKLFDTVFSKKEKVTVIETDLFESTISYERYTLELQVKKDD